MVWSFEEGMEEPGIGPSEGTQELYVFFV